MLTPCLRAQVTINKNLQDSMEMDQQTSAEGNPECQAGSKDRVHLLPAEPAPLPEKGGQDPEGWPGTRGKDESSVIKGTGSRGWAWVTESDSECPACWAQAYDQLQICLLTQPQYCPGPGSAHTPSTSGQVAGTRFPSTERMVNPAQRTRAAQSDSREGKLGIQAGWQLHSRAPTSQALRGKDSWEAVPLAQCT